MLILSKIKEYQYLYSKKKKKKYNNDLAIKEVKSKYEDLRSEYSYFHHYFWNLAPNFLRGHRDYFRKEQRGFGEDAFHSMWFKLFEEFKPKNILEIGVYRGQTLSLFSLLSNFFSLDSNIHGISPFTDSGDQVSIYLKNLNYLDDIKKNFLFFNLNIPNLHKGFSNDIEMLNIIASISWDLIYIDGNHDYEIAKSDFLACSYSLKIGGMLILDDSALYSSYKPFPFSTAGHPGPSKVALEIDKNKFQEILSVGHNRVFIKLK